MAKEKILINAYVEGFNCKYADVTTELSKNMALKLSTR